MLLAPGLLAVAFGATPSIATSSAAEALARRVEERQRNVQDLQGRFTQTYRSGVLGRDVVERGTVSIKRPGRMRWEYRDPEAKTFVSDGKSFYFYVPADKQVIVRTILSLAESLNLKVTAEGIETQELALTLQKMGCWQGQGYHFAKPMNESDAFDYWRARWNFETI